MPALTGMRVLDATQYEAGPSATQALAWLGADVVKVERPGTGDPGRGGGLGTNTAYFLNWNSNKRSVTLALETPEGRDLLLRMAPHYDVFVENYAPGVVEKLDIGYDVFQRANPGIIYAQVKGFGLDGPYSKYKCYDMVAQAAAGAFSITGYGDGPPTRPGPTLADSGTGVQLALAITAAYIQKLRTGEGQHIELSMQEAVTYYMRTMVANGSDWGRQATPRTGNGLGAMMNLYPCKPFGANDYVYLMLVTRPMWQTLCKAIGRADLIEDPRYASGKARRENGDALYEEIARWTRDRTKHEAMRELGEAGVPCSAVLDTRDLFDDPHLSERGFVHHVDHADQGTVPLLGFAPRLSKSDVPIQPSPLLGEHTEAVLADDLGLSEEELAALRERGALG
ncbi:MAG: CoA transferase [Deltaproteobacteria bacterium]|nr:CoA transferase [Deltaproteobacteria bacterium]MBW2413881.1 CoA transferase [Deltaproteobacteria bacterium]